MKMYGGMDVCSHVFFTSALVASEWLASQPSCFAPGTHCIGGWVAPSASLDAVERRKSCLHRDSNSDVSAVQPVAVPAPSVNFQTKLKLTIDLPRYEYASSTYEIRPAIFSRETVRQYSALYVPTLLYRSR
jgi:hypothetical protein